MAIWSGTIDYLEFDHLKVFPLAMVGLLLTYSRVQPLGLIPFQYDSSASDSSYSGRSIRGCGHHIWKRAPWKQSRSKKNQVDSFLFRIAIASLLHTEYFPICGCLRYSALWIRTLMALCDLPLIGLWKVEGYKLCPRAYFLASHEAIKMNPFNTGIGFSGLVSLTCFKFSVHPHVHLTK